MDAYDIYAPTSQSVKAAVGVTLIYRAFHLILHRDIAKSS
jgi:hypothetical protein